MRVYICTDWNAASYWAALDIYWERDDDWSPRFLGPEILVDMENPPPCHFGPLEQWCDRDGLGDFMGHSCAGRRRP